MQPKPVSPPPPDTQSTPVAATPREQNQVTTPTDTPAPPELKAFTDALKDVKAYIDDKSKILMEVKNLLDTKGTQETPPAPTRDLGPALDAALKPLSETLSTIDSTTAGSSRDLSNHIWECGGRHQAMDGTLSGVHGMVRDLQNRVGTTQRKLDDWVKSWSDNTGTMDDPPGVTKCLCQLREVQDELSRSSQSTEALTQRVDPITESIGTLSTRIQSMQTLLDKMAAARPKAPPPAFPAPDLPAAEAAGPPPHQPPGSWHTPSQPPGMAAANPSPAPQGLPLTTPPAYIPSIGASIQAPPAASQGVPAGANVINLNPPSTARYGHCVDGRSCLSDPDHHGQGDQLRVQTLALFLSPRLWLFPCLRPTLPVRCTPCKKNLRRRLSRELSVVMFCS